jgi:hypothetical protein
MSWSYRVVKDMDASYSIHQVYTNEIGDIINISEQPTYPIGEDTESLIWQLERMIGACKKPIIDYNTGEELN